MLNQLPKRRLDFEEDEPKDTGSSSSSSGMMGYIPGVGIILGGVGKAAANLSGAGEIIGTIAGTTVGVAAIGAIETGSALYHTGATVAGVLMPYLTGEGEDSLPPSIENTPVEKKKGSKKVGLANKVEIAPEAEHEKKGKPGRPRGSSLLPARQDEDKPARKTRSGKNY